MRAYFLPRLVADLVEGRAWLVFAVLSALFPVLPKPELLPTEPPSSKNL
jgi:hypothetical protein